VLNPSSYCNMKNLYRPLTAVLSLVFLLSFGNTAYSNPLAVVNATHQVSITPGDSTDTPEDKRVPDFTLKRMNGDTFTLSEHEGEIIVLNFWATWCGPCRKEMPRFIELQEEMAGQDVQFVGIAIDEAGWDVIRPFAKKLDVNYPIVWDEGFDITKKYGPLRGIPTTFIINKEGELAHTAAGVINKWKLKSTLNWIIDRNS